MSAHGTIRLRRDEGGIYQGFIVASGRLVLASVVLVFLIHQALTTDYSYVWFLIALVASVMVFSGVHWLKLGRRVQEIELRPGGMLRIRYPLGQREFSSDALGWVKVYRGRVVIGQDGDEYELRGVDASLDPLVRRLAELGVEISDRRD